MLQTKRVVCAHTTNSYNSQFVSITYYIYTNTSSGLCLLFCIRYNYAATKITFILFAWTLTVVHAVHYCPQWLSLLLSFSVYQDQLVMSCNRWGTRPKIVRWHVGSISICNALRASSYGTHVSFSLFLSLSLCGISALFLLIFDFIFDSKQQIVLVNAHTKDECSLFA